jgi:hypothetical protein
LDMLNHDSSIKSLVCVNGAKPFLLEVNSKLIFGGSNNTAAKDDKNKLGKAPAYLVIEPKGLVDNIFNQLSLISLRRAMATTSEMKNLSEWDGVGKMMDCNELETFALIAGELEEALFDAKSGAKEAKAMNDASVASYLRGREKTLEKG